LGGHWRINGSYPLAPNKRLLSERNLAAPVAGVYGQVMRVDDVSVAHVTVSAGNQTTLTDAKGVFVLTGIPAGHQVLTIDGASANRSGVEYGSFLVGVNLKQQTMTPMPQVLYLPRIRAQDKVDIPSPTTTETIITNPGMPGYTGLRHPTRTDYDLCTDWTSSRFL
jgi:hypothetical protein